METMNPVPNLSSVMNLLAKYVPSKISAKLRGQVRRSLVLAAKGVEIAGKPALS
jgi:hypothetical protein